MRISSDLFNAFLKCSTKCWLRAAGEPASGYAYAEWVKSQNGSYHATEIERLLSETPKNEVAVSPPLENLKAAQWRLATNLAARRPREEDFLPYRTGPRRLIAAFAAVVPF